MEGRISLSFCREPSWFAGAAVDGRLRQVIACRDLRTGRIIGFGCRSIRDAYVNGRSSVVGYLSNLRLLPEHRGLGLVARGYAVFRELHGDGRAPFYLTTIGAGNRTALSVLTSGRAGLPAYHPAGAYYTFVVPLPRRRKRSAVGKIDVRPATAEDLPAVLDFLATVAAQRQFFPRLEANDFLSPEGTMRGLSFDKLLLAERGGRLVGTLAGWDQHSYRQTVVCAYHGRLRALRPLYNAWAWFINRPGLPKPGQAFPYLMGALPAVAADDDNTFAALLEDLRRRAAGGPWGYLLIGLHERDPLLRVVQRYQPMCYMTHLFLVCWPDGEEARCAVDGRTPYLEAGSL